MCCLIGVVFHLRSAVQGGSVCAVGLGGLMTVLGNLLTSFSALHSTRACWWAANVGFGKKTVTDELY